MSDTNITNKPDVLENESLENTPKNEDILKLEKVIEEEEEKLSKIKEQSDLYREERRQKAIDKRKKEEIKKYKNQKIYIDKKQEKGWKQSDYLLKMIGFITIVLLLVLIPLKMIEDRSANDYGSTKQESKRPFEYSGIFDETEGGLTAIVSKVVRTKDDKLELTVMFLNTTNEDIHIQPQNIKLDGKDMSNQSKSDFAPKITIRNSEGDKLRFEKFVFVFDNFTVSNKMEFEVHFQSKMEHQPLTVELTDLLVQENDG